MKTKLSFAVMEIFLSISVTIRAQITFQKTIGGTSDDIALDIQQTNNGGYIVTGETGSFGAGGSDIFLVKLNKNGDISWSKTYGGTNSEYGNSVIQTIDNGYIITGWTSSFGSGGEDAFLIKTDANGDTLWTRTYGGASSDPGRSVLQNADGSYIIAGAVMSYGQGYWDVYLIKTDINGNLLWTKTYGGTDQDWGYRVAQTSDNGYIITGFTRSFGAGDADIYFIKTDSKGDTLWTKTYGGSNFERGYWAQQTIDGGFIIVGETSSFGAGNLDVYLIKTDSKGDILWTKTYGGISSDVGFSVQQTSDNGYFLTAQTSSFGAGGGQPDVYLIKTDSKGDTLWTKTYGGIGGEFWFYGQVTDIGEYIIGARSNSFGAGDQDFYIIKTDANGNSGCNQYSTKTITGSSTTLVHSGGVVGSGGVAHNAKFIFKNPTIIEKNLCSTTNIEYLDLINGIKIYPNPSHGEFIVEMNSTLSEYHMAIFNSIGQEVFTENLKLFSGRLIKHFDLSYLPSGIYLIKLSTIRGVINKRIIIEQFDRIP